MIATGLALLGFLLGVGLVDVYAFLTGPRLPAPAGRGGGTGLGAVGMCLVYGLRDSPMRI